MKLMKYKTWWYIYRRSIREITSKLFTRFLQALNGKGNEGKSDEESVLTKEKNELMRLNKQLEGMNRAKPPFSEAFLAKVEGVKASIAQLEAKIAAEQIHQSNKQLQLLKVSQEIHDEITKRWPSKFGFVKEEMRNEYAARIQQIMQYAHWFVEYMTGLVREELQQPQQQQQLSARRGAEEEEAEYRSEVIQNFRKYYPKVWDAFLVARNITQDI